jgi:hypothetical protein
MIQYLGQGLEKLKQKWQLHSWWQVVAILCVFSFAGSSVVFLRPLLFHLLGFQADTPWLLKVSAYLLFVFPAYQLLLLGFGWLLGQHTFFIQKAKKLATIMKAKRKPEKTGINPF